MLAVLIDARMNAGALLFSDLVGVVLDNFGHVGRTAYTTWITRLKIWPDATEVLIEYFGVLATSAPEVRASAVMPYTATHFLILGILCGAACLWDLARRRIPNVIVASLLATGLWAQATTTSSLGALEALGAGVLVLVALYPLWTRGGIGGGDVKLALAAGTWVGFGRLPMFLLAGAIGGGVVSACCYLRSRDDARSAIRTNLWMVIAMREMPDAPATRAGKGRVSVPYALAISAAIFAALLLKIPALS